MTDQEAIKKIAEELLVMNWDGCEANAREAWNNPNSSLDAKGIEHSVWETDAKHLLRIIESLGYRKPPDSNDQYIACPFCGDGEDYDKIGLKYHLTNYCEEYQNTEAIL